jgi:hypothetical protein
MEDIIRMVSRQGFIEVLQKRLAKRPGTRRRLIYYEMEDEMEMEYGGTVFPSYEAFRQYYYRHITAKSRR